MITNLNTARAIKSNDARNLTPLELLRYLATEMEAGRLKATKLCCHWTEGEEEQFRRGAAYAGIDRMQAIALLNVALIDSLDAWRQG